uniref:CSON001738 protein n=1 Tax=Culicoides sonorensis TaxID=179676 RepID=A0A336KQR0_CULSO
MLKFICVATTLCLIIAPKLTSAYPSGTNGCTNSCFERNEVCGTDDAAQTRTFSSLCALKSHNCQHGTKYIKTLDGPCP